MDTPQYHRTVTSGQSIRLFECSRLKASLTQHRCARMWSGEYGFPCDVCPVGERHAAEHGMRRATDMARSKIGRPCCRCGRLENRLIGARVCISCFNREREWCIGRNRKGNPPTIPLMWHEALVTSPGGLAGTRRLSGIAVQDLGAGDYSLRLAALDEAEVERVVGSIWPAAEVIAIGPATQPETAGDQRRSSAKQADLNAESCTAWT